MMIVTMTIIDDDDVDSEDDDKDDNGSLPIQPGGVVITPPRPTNYGCHTATINPICMLTTMTVMMMMMIKLMT